MPFWFYIAGRGHSGSTMLDAMLGNARNIESVGELISGMDRYDALCSCKETFRDCPFWFRARKWFEVKSDVSWDQATRSTKNQAHIKYFFRTVFASPCDSWVSRLKSHNDNLAEAIGASSGKEVDAIVDSSKEITRALFLLRFFPRSKVIHLVRHPVNVLGSSFSRLKKGDGFRFLRVHFTPRRLFGPFLFVNTVSWMVSNVLLELMRFYHKDRILRVKYEDLIFSPEEQLNRIEKFSGVSLDVLRRRIRNRGIFKIEHNIGGNRMRMTGSFVLDPKKASHSRLPNRYTPMVHALCWPMLLKYKYYN
jgi:hypothetical protein